MEREDRIKDIHAVLFDLDGTLVNTEILYNRFWVEAARHFGYPMEYRHALMLRSLAKEHAEPLLRKTVCPDFDYFKVREYRRKIMNDYVDEHGLVPKPFMAETLRRLKEGGMQIALATATPLDRATQYLRRLDVLQYFDAFSTADMVKHGKPAPDIYVHAMELLGCNPEQAAAVEDSPTGVRSANASGAFTIMIPDMDDPDEETAAMCDCIFPTLLQITELFGV